eukprot:g12823.t1
MATRFAEALAVVRSMALQNGQLQAVAHLEVSAATTTLGGPEMPTTRTRLVPAQERDWGRMGGDRELGRLGGRALPIRV